MLRIVILLIRAISRAQRIWAWFVKSPTRVKYATFLLILAGCILLATALGLRAQETQTEGHVEFAPGSTGEIDAPIAGIVKGAEDLGRHLRETLTPQDAAPGAFGDIDFEALRDRALANPRVRALLGAEGAEALGAGGEKPRFDGARIFLLASFSIPKPSLRQMMEEAKAHNVPIVFRGFVNNSVYDTRAAIEATFGTADESVGYAIDPTIFTRFRVTSVPQVIAVDGTIDVCETPGCEGDPIPPHDVVRGNVPLRYALELIAAQGEIGQADAQALLSGGQSNE